MIVVNPDLCPQNHRCPVINICPAGAISQKPGQAPSVDQEKCIHCWKCIQRCPAFVEQENLTLAGHER